MFLGIEIGGTKLQLGVGDGRGSPIVEVARRTIDRTQGAEGIRAQIAEAGRELMAKHRIERVGYGFGGPISPATGRVVTSHQVAGWDDFPLVKWTEETLGVPAILGNDCDSAALAEAKFGAGREARIVFYVTVGTGVGGGLVIDRRLHGARRPAVAEIGHLRPGLGATDPHDTVESRSAGPGIEASARRLVEAALRDEAGAEQAAADAKDLLSRAQGKAESISAKILGEAAAQGNTVALAAINGGLQALGWALAQVITLIAPEILVVGGGVSLMGERSFYDPLEREVQKYVFPPLRGSYLIAPPELGELVVVYGALALAAEA